MKLRKDMSLEQKMEHIVTYYKWHILGACAGIGLIIFLIVHFAFPAEKTQFSCALINWQIDYDRDKELEKSFAKAADLDEALVDIDSDYNISYPGHEIEAANEGIYDKFFIKYSNMEFDAMITTVDFAEYCQSLGAEFVDVSQFDTNGLEIYDKEGISGIDVTDNQLLKKAGKPENEQFILVFIKDGANLDKCQMFIDYIG